MQEEGVLDPTDKEVAAAMTAAAALSVVDLLIAREGLTENHLVLPDRRAFIRTKKRDTELQLLRS